MGKFLKILRYIANLIAIMEACFSKEQTPYKQNSSLTQPLLDDETKRSDFKPDQGVSANEPANSPDVKAFLSSHLLKKEFWQTQTKIDPQNTTCEDPFALVSGIGPVPPILENHQTRTVMTVKIISFDDAIIDRTSTGFVIDIGGISYKLENFDMLLKREISEGDFKKDLVKNNPDKFKKIWEILTSDSLFVAFYY